MEDEKNLPVFVSEPDRKKQRALIIIALAVIIASAFLLRVWSADSRDLIGDEAAYAFRSVGYVDYLGTSFQTQPIEWYKNQELPWWTTLSFHDHPPLGFLIQHAFFQVFGESAGVARLPAILFGTISVFLIYAISRRFLAEWVAITAAALFAINSASVWIFRTALLEPILIFLILVNIYIFFKFAGDALWRRRYWWLFGGTLGLIFLTKYTGVFVIPPYAVYIFIFHKELLKNWRTYAAFFTAILLFSPVVIYNWGLYKATGHFDLQIAYFLGQETPEWAGLLGKTDASFLNIFTNWIEVFGAATTILFLIGIVWSIIVFRQQKNGGITFLWLYTFSVTALLVLTGAAERFLTLYIPVAVIFGAFGVRWLWQFKKDSLWHYFFLACILALLVGEVTFAVDKNFVHYPDFGVAKLDQYFEHEFANKKSAIIPETDNPHLTQIVYDFARRQNSKEEGLYAIIYNDNIALGTLQWIFYRRFFYENIPTFFVENFNQTRALAGADSFKSFTLYFVQSTSHTLLNEFKRSKTAGLEFENDLIDRGLKADAVIYNKDGLPMFAVYKFAL